MKNGSFIINSARGGIINEDDLKYALLNNLIAGAAIDAYVEEPPTDKELLSLPNLICTPHILLMLCPVNDRTDCGCHNERNNTLAEKYRKLAEKEANVIFGGRLGQYRYYDMAPIIEQVLYMNLF